YRAMTNINVLVRKASTAIALQDNNAHSKTVVEELFKCMGAVYWVPEEYIDVWTGLVGSGPAFIAEIIDGLVLGAVASGMPRDIAYKSILDVLEGTAILLREIDSHPAVVRDEVITPAGTTIRGIMMMESEGVKSALMKTIESAYKRSSEIGIEIDQYVRRELNL
ncbi:MAG: pyrroline-5-carboxylate reductase dimerization domain-containing protein, partial [Desulfurococcaceae archaeon]